MIRPEVAGGLLATRCRETIFWALLLSGCGYSSVHAPERARMWVSPGPSAIADPAAAEAVVFGARAALDAEGALAAGPSGASGRRLVVRIVALEESTAGIVLSEGRPVGRGSRLVLRGEATLEASPSGGSERWEATVAEAVGPRGDAVAELRSRDDALRELGRNLGGELARRALGTSGRAPGRMWYGLAP